MQSGEKNLIISPPAIAMPPASLCFTDVTFFLMSPLSIDNWLTDRNMDGCVNTVDEKITTATILVNFGPVTPEILWRIWWWLHVG